MMHRISACKPGKLEHDSQGIGTPISCAILRRMHIYSGPSPLASRSVDERSQAQRSTEDAVNGHQSKGLFVDIRRLPSSLPSCDELFLAAPLSTYLPGAQLRLFLVPFASSLQPLLTFALPPLLSACVSALWLLAPGLPGLVWRLRECVPRRAFPFPSFCAPARPSPAQLLLPHLSLFSRPRLLSSPSLTALPFVAFSRPLVPCVAVQRGLWQAVPLSRHAVSSRLPVGHVARRGTWPIRLWSGHKFCRTSPVLARL
jgi:hypothetical protein